MEMTNQVLALFSPGEVKIGVDIAEQLNISLQRVHAHCRCLVCAGKLATTEVEVRLGFFKSYTVKGYYLK